MLWWHVMQLPVLSPVSVSTRTQDSFQAKRYWISWDLKKPNLFKNNFTNTSNNVKSQIQNKKNGGISELLITLNRVIRNQGTYFVVIMNNRHKIISVPGAPLYGIGGFFPKKSFSWEGKNFYGQTKVMRLFSIGLMIRSCQLLGGISWMINAFSSRPNLNIKASLTIL